MLTTQPGQVETAASAQDPANPGDSSERDLEVLGSQLAHSHAVSERLISNRWLLDRLRDQEALLQTIYQQFKNSAQEELGYSSAAEWLLDNFHVVQQTIRLIREELPPGYYHRLPKLGSPPLAGYPRIFALALHLVEHSQSQLDPAQIARFVDGYQQVLPLTIGELWALPIMLRLGILTSLTLALSCITKIEAGDGLAVLHSQLSRRLPDETIVASCFSSLRLLATQDWSAFFEQVSQTETILRGDPAGVYPQMDFDTRDRYRQVVEQLARATHSREEAVARKTIELAQHSTDDHQGPLRRMRTSHVGYYLIDAGRAELEGALGYHPDAGTRMKRWVLKHPTFVYLGSIASLTALSLVGLLGYAAASGGTPLQLAGVLMLALLPVLAVVVSLTNWVITHSVPPRLLPRLDYADGIPETCRTAVVIPSLIATERDIQVLLEQLELLYLHNPEPNLIFALLTDFSDAPAPHMPEDDGLIEKIVSGIQALNRKYGGSGTEQFYLFHRERRWNPGEDCWMAWERKRGKLAEFNRLVLGDQDTSFVVKIGDLTVLPGIKYVITLDADTILPQGAASRLVATLAHPLNRAEFAPDSNRLRAGYTVLQPRVEIKPTSANQSLFTRIFAGDIGLDLYTRAVSDVYQDFFGEGSYIGKGIYDVAAFERCVAGRIPDNTLLSHDLFEGIHGRVALVTDVLLFEDYPPAYLVYSHRLHRWMRGDWQLVPWLLPRVPAADGNRRPNHLPVLSRWKIVDNLRRSLFTPALLALLFFGWVALPGSPVFWTLIALLAPAVSLLMDSLSWLSRMPENLAAYDSLRPLKLEMVRALLALILVPYETLIALDAILTTLYRLSITRKHLLEWTTAANTTRLFRRDANLGRAWRQMRPASLLALALVALAALLRPESLPISLPILAMWLAAPQIVHQISKPISRQAARPSEEQSLQLRALARRTWLFFEQFAGPNDNWLPPDHYQESPRGVVAHHTSPTNVGLFFLAVLAAYDLGYIGLMELVLRLQATFEALGKLERYRGHFLNWYDTRTLEPLYPRYVSTVDSGNLAACLITLKHGCKMLAHTHGQRAQRWQGLLDLLAMLDSSLAALTGEGVETAVAPLRAHLSRVRAQILTVVDRPDQWAETLTQLQGESWQELSRLLVNLIEAGLPSLDTAALSNLRIQIEHFNLQLISMGRDMEPLPWRLLLNQKPALFALPGTDRAILESANALLDMLAAMSIPRIDEVGELSETVRGRLTALQEQLVDGAGPEEALQEARTWCRRLAEALMAMQMRVRPLLIGLQSLEEQAEVFLQAMDFRFLYQPQRKVFHIGYNLVADKLDNNYYDLLASEARIASIVAIAKGDVPVSHWLHLARPVTRIDGQQVLLSWSGTMFEYLMPDLLMQDCEGTFLYESSHGAVDVQIAYGRQKHVPWGISESGYYAFDASSNYQYRAFGLPQLGFKRNLGDDLVIAPYASLLALPLRPDAVLQNMADLDALGMLGQYGFYEALDFTPSRLPLGQRHMKIQSYMSHHQAMILLTLTNYLQDYVMIRRFHADPRVKSVDLLLQEKIPQNAPAEFPHQNDMRPRRLAPAPVSLAPWKVSVDSPAPAAHFLSNGDYGMLITAAGAGFSQWQDIALTRWRADTTLEDDGVWVYVQDRESGALWSATYQPTAARPDSQEVLFYPHKVEFRRADHKIGLRLEVTVAPVEAVEIRRITLINHTDQARRLTLTSYGEVVLAPQATDQRHPAFNKLFIESEYVPDTGTLLFRRRPRASTEKPLYLAHTLIAEQDSPAAYETDRARFLGRGGTLRAPAALTGSGLSGTTGATLDPVMALSTEIDLEPHGTAQIAFLTLAAESRAEALALAAHYRSWFVIERALEQSRGQSERDLRQRGLTAPDLEQIQRLLSRLLYPHPALRAAPSILSTNTLGQPGLWAYGISGDYPILLVHFYEQHVGLLSDLLNAHTYCRERQIRINLVILNEGDTGYAQELNDQLHRQIVHTGNDTWLNRREGIFVLRASQMPETDRILLDTVAGVVLDDRRGSLAEQLQHEREQPPRLPPFNPSPLHRDAAPTAPVARPAHLLFDNGLGGFSPDGKEYLIYLKPGQCTPQPWINVIANARFGFLVSENGSGSTWAVNSGENRLTPWHNDPVSDTPGEALYLRDEETARIWSPTPAPARASAPYLIRHGAGYTIFEHASHGLRQEMRVFAAQDAPVKVVWLRLENTWQHPRRITATYYAEWVLGTLRESAQPYVIPEFDAQSNALLARNPYNVEFGEQVAFLAATRPPHGLTTDRGEFLGRMGSFGDPAALGRIGLAEHVQAGLDPCAAIQVHFDLAPGGAEEVVFLLGAGANRQEALDLIARYQAPSAVEAAWRALDTFWDETLGAITVQTPDPAMNLLLNRWLLYQTLSCRLWARSALYQSSGAYGFRDQLQDVLALFYTAPALAREHILRAASHQFEAGDVLHWWHPPSGRGVRTRIADDLIWLPFVTAQYVNVTGDQSILDEQVPFLKGDLLRDDEEEHYGYYEATATCYSLYEHCQRALKKGLTAGPHGLPLMGTGDWNDGMNRVGAGGVGESVWLGWFLYTSLIRFAALCEQIGDPQSASTYRQQAEQIRKAIEANAWDGRWYRRAYYDDGEPLGSSRNRECAIDSIAQSWAVLSRGGNHARAAQAMESVAERLVRPDVGIIRLLTPPFDNTPHDPGYIKGYLPGIRENGGQYTHAALWAVWAFAELGQADQATSLFKLLNPIYHSDSPEKVERYKAEPYVIAADVYDADAHRGRGGWTWYTGSASWMYRLGLEAILGLKQSGGILRFVPHIASDWPSYEVTYRYGDTLYHIQVSNPEGVYSGVKSVTLDGEYLPEPEVQLVQDGSRHEIRVELGFLGPRGEL